MSSPKVSKIVVQIGDIEASLTPEEARELMESLEALFGEQEPIIIHDHHYERPRWDNPSRWWYTTTLDNTAPNIGASYRISYKSE